MAIYRKGTAAIDASGVVTGNGTDFKAALNLIRVGATMIFLSGEKPVLATVDTIVSDTEIRTINSGGETASDGDYVILLSDALSVDGLAQDVAETLRYYQGKESAIQDAIDVFNGFNLQEFKDLQQDTRDNASSASNSAQNAAGSASAAAQSQQAAANSASASSGSAAASANSASAASDSASRAKSEADRATAANLSWLVQDSPNSVIYSPDKTKRLLIGNSGTFVFQNSGDGSTVPIPVSSGGTGVTTLDGLRSNLGISRSGTATFGGVSLDTNGSSAGGILQSRRLDNSGNEVSWSRFYDEYSGGITWSTIGTKGVNGSYYYQFGDDGTFQGARAITAGSGGVNSGGHLKINQGSRAYVITTGGGNKDISMLIAPVSGDPPNDTWINLMEGRWYDGAWRFGGVRGSSTDIKCVRVEINSQNSGSKYFNFYDANGGYLETPRGLKTNAHGIGWGDVEGTMKSSVDCGSMTGNDGQYVSLISGSTTASGGYRTNASFGLISNGSSRWADMVLKMLGDGQYHRGFQFTARGGDINCWAQGSDWDTQPYTFTKAASSDRDIKYDIVYTDGKESYERVKQWMPTLFKYKGSETQRYGLIAQDLMAVDDQYVKLVPGSPIFGDVTTIDENGKEVTRKEEVDRKDDSLALDTNVMLADMACAFRYASDQMESMQAELQILKDAVANLTEGK